MFSIERDLEDVVGLGLSVICFFGAIHFVKLIWFVEYLGFPFVLKKKENPRWTKKI